MDVVQKPVGNENHLRLGRKKALIQEIYKHYVFDLGRFAGAGTISALTFPYFVILMRSPLFARFTNSSKRLFASVNPIVSMTLYSRKSSAMLPRTWVTASNIISSPHPSQAFILGLDTEG